MTPGTKARAYEVLTLIGTGGMAEIYRARDPRPDCELAVKMVITAVTTWSRALSSAPVACSVFAGAVLRNRGTKKALIVAALSGMSHNGERHFCANVAVGMTIANRPA